MKYLVAVVMLLAMISCGKYEEKSTSVENEKKVVQKKESITEKDVKREKIPSQEESVDISNELEALKKMPVPKKEKSPKNDNKCVAYKDADADGYGDENNSIEFDCETDPKVGYVLKAGDCNDRNRYKNPGAVETCNGTDDNCDGIVDPPESDMCNRYYRDMDKDGFGTSDFKCLCVSEGDFVAMETGDCDDQNRFVHKNAKEKCNGVDDNCNGQVDEGEGLEDCRPFYFDKDGDGYGYQKKSKCLCKAKGLFRAEMLGDCNDDVFSINPGVAEIFDRRDNNCNGAIDENVGIKPKQRHHKRPHNRNNKYKNKPEEKQPVKEEEKKKKKKNSSSMVL